MGWINQRTIKSGSSTRIYTISEWEENGVPTGRFGCNCPGWKSHRKCKHLAAGNLPSHDNRRMDRPVSDDDRPKPRISSTEFVDTGKHYNPGEGIGTPDQWRDILSGMAEGRGPLKSPAPVGASVDAELAADLAAIGLFALPPDIDILVAAMQKRAEVLQDPVTGNMDEFWTMFKSYERLVEWY